MIQRIAFGLFAICILIGLIAIDAQLARTPPFWPSLLSRGSVIPIAAGVIALLACQELCELFRRLNIHTYTRTAAVSCAAIVLAPWLSAAGVFGRGPLHLEAFQLQIALVGMALLVTGIAAVRRQDVRAGLVSIAATWLVIGYAGVLPSFFTLLRCDVNLPGQVGAWVTLVVLAVCKSADIGAYFAGSLFGRHKLIPEVSPGKSIEGLIGGILASCAVSALLLVVHDRTMVEESLVSTLSLIDRFTLLANDMTGLYRNMTWTQTLIFASVMAVVGQLGDLIESVFKRSAGAKDSGKILPGFGGILDMIDSPVAAAPLAWFLLTRLWAIV